MKTKFCAYHYVKLIGFQVFHQQITTQNCVQRKVKHFDHVPSQTCYLYTCHQNLLCLVTVGCPGVNTQIPIASTKIITLRCNCWQTSKISMGYTSSSILKYIFHIKPTNLLYILFVFSWIYMLFTLILVWLISTIFHKIKLYLPLFS